MNTEALTDTPFDGVSTWVILSMAVVGVLLVIACIVSLVISIYLSISYVKYNRRRNSLGLAGKDIARKILDDHGLIHIKVSCTGSITFGNSYSHYFKKVRLRRRTWKKDSVTSLAMAAQKSMLAILDKEGDSDMKKRITLTPIIYFGPIAFIPLVIVGVLLDILVFTSAGGICTLILTLVGLAFYVLSFVMSLMILKTEVKAQQRALALMQEDGLATEEELDMCRHLFRLYNIEYVNDMIIALLELIYRVLQIVASVQSNNSSSRK